MPLKYVSLWLVLLPVFSFGQISQSDFEYTREFTWGVNKNTNGGLIGGVMLKHSRLRQNNIYQTFGLELLNIKHPKEQRYTSRQTGTSFIWGKQNYLYAIRFQPDGGSGSGSHIDLHALLRCLFEHQFFIPVL
jgi:hypothetical protein